MYNKYVYVHSCAPLGSPLSCQNGDDRCMLGLCDVNYLFTLFRPAHFFHLFALRLYWHFLFTGDIIQLNGELSRSPAAKI